MWPFTRKRKEKPVPSVEEAMRLTGMSAVQLERLFLEDLLAHGDDPFADAPDHIRISLEKKYPDLAARAKRKFGRSDAGIAAPEVRRNPDDMPSMVAIAVPARFSYPDLARHISTFAPDKQLVSLVSIGWTNTPEQALRLIGHLYSFVDDSKLAVLRFPVTAAAEDHLIIRATFMRDTVGEVRQTTLPDLAERLSQLARERRLHVMAVPL
jgi:hypothetical protein